MSTPQSLTLEQFCNNIRNVISDANLASWVTAEVAQAQVSRGHYYITLSQKSDTSDAPVASLRCQIWSSNVFRVLGPLRLATGDDIRDGMKILAYVSVSFHPVYGMSGQILAIDPQYTLGDMERRRQEILRQLAADGVTEMNKELPLPKVIQRVAVVSAATAAGYGDFCDQLRSNPYAIDFRPVLFPAAMQGESAEASIVDALNKIAAEVDDFDVVVIIRGGGSKMDLACFDSYLMASNVAQFPLPVITGIGHERDTSIVDIVAHTAVKTPTAVAEFLIQHDADFLALLDDLTARATRAAEASLSAAIYGVDALRLRLLASASAILASARSRSDSLALRAMSAASERLARQDMTFQMLRQRLLSAARARLDVEARRQEAFERHVAAIDPREVLRRGFSVTTDAEGNRITNAATLKKGDGITTFFADGKVSSVVS